MNMTQAQTTTSQSLGHFNELLPCEVPSDRTQQWVDPWLLFNNSFEFAHCHELLILGKVCVMGNLFLCSLSGSAHSVSSQIWVLPYVSCYFHLTTPRKTWPEKRTEVPQYASSQLILDSYGGNSKKYLNLALVWAMLQKLASSLPELGTGSTLPCI